MTTGLLTTTTAGLDERAAVRRVLQRFGFGPRPGEVERAAAAGFAATVDALFRPGSDAGVTATPPPAVSVAPTHPAGEKRTVQQRQAENQAIAAQTTDLQLWWLDRMVAAEEPLRERLTFFWHGHFATSVRKVRDNRLMLVQNEQFRRLGAGDFRELARTMVADPALLLWLDGQQNRKGKPNENLAREFMELFTLGVGHYTETDVREAARALTGWKLDRSTGTATFAPALHDNGAKTILGRTATFDAPGFVDLLVDQPSSPVFLAGRLWTRFVADQPPTPSTMAALVAAYEPGRDVTALLRAIVGSTEFRDPGSVLVRQPVEWLVAALRALRIRPGALPKATQQTLRAGLAGLGQELFAPPNVGGWPAGNEWLTTVAAGTRLRLAQVLTQAADLGAVAGQPAGQRVDAVAALLGLGSWTDRTRAALQGVAGNPPQLVALALASPEYAVSG